jgi:hypothetical protein
VSEKRRPFKGKFSNLKLDKVAKAKNQGKKPKKSKNARKPLNNTPSASAFLAPGSPPPESSPHGVAVSAHVVQQCAFTEEETTGKEEKNQEEEEQVTEDPPSKRLSEEEVRYYDYS